MLEDPVEYIYNMVPTSGEQLPHIGSQEGPTERPSKITIGRQEVPFSWTSPK